MSKISKVILTISLTFVSQFSVAEIEIIRGGCFESSQVEFAKSGQKWLALDAIGKKEVEIKVLQKIPEQPGTPGETEVSFPGSDKFHGFLIRGMDLKNNRVNNSIVRTSTSTMHLGQLFSLQGWPFIPIFASGNVSAPDDKKSFPIFSPFELRIGNKDRRKVIYSDNVVHPPSITILGDLNGDGIKDFVISNDPHEKSIVRFTLFISVHKGGNFKDIDFREVVTLETYHCSEID